VLPYAARCEEINYYDGIVTKHSPLGKGKGKGGTGGTGMKIIRVVSRVLGYAATGFMVVLMLLTVVDVFLRYFFNAPITGTTEISRLLMVIIVFPALGWAAIDRAHVRVDLVVSRIPPRVQAILGSITFLFALVTYGIITWQSILEAAVVNRQTSLLHLPFTPFYWVMSGGFVVFCLAIAALVIEDITKAVKK
jgi:TRAP-type C4-dicarboxylate transport system permease small subunit